MPPSLRATPSLREEYLFFLPQRGPRREEYLFFLPQRGPRLEGELAGRSAFRLSEYDSPSKIEGVAHRAGGV